VTGKPNVDRLQKLYRAVGPHRELREKLPPSYALRELTRKAPIAGRRFSALYERSLYMKHLVSRVLTVRPRYRLGKGSLRVIGGRAPLILGGGIRTYITVFWSLAWSASDNRCTWPLADPLRIQTTRS